MSNPVITPAEVQALRVSNGRLVRKTNKYGVSPVESRTYAGIRFDSRREMEVYQALDVERAAGLIERIDRQVKFPLVVKDKLICTFVADFKVMRTNSGVMDLEVIEVKGHPTRDYRIKEKLFRALYPSMKLSVVK